MWTFKMSANDLQSLSTSSISTFAFTILTINKKMKIMQTLAYLSHAIYEGIQRQFAFYAIWKIV